VPHPKDTGEHMAAGKTFISVDNYRTCFDVLRTQASKEYGLGNLEVEVPGCRAMLYNTMLAVSREFQGEGCIQTDDMNNVAINMVLRSLLGSREDEEDAGACDPGLAGSSGLGGGDPSSSAGRASMRMRPHYVLINGFDRDWLSAPQRFSFSVSLRTPLRGVTQVWTSSVIVPAEIRDEAGGRRSLNYVPRDVFLNDYDLDVPYVVLTLDELGDVYEGANERLNRGFSKLIYHKSYRTSYGRAYIILKPVQAEVKVFDVPTTLSRLSVSITRPNGQLLNSSTDSHKLFKLEHEAYNPLYLKLITCAYYDRNEFFVGDTIVVSGFAIEPLLGPNAPKTVSEQLLEDFINRAEGHDVRQLGKPNDEGFYRWFYIDAPRHFDDTHGTLQCNHALVHALQDYNERTSFDDIRRPPNGALLNMSLQSSVSFTCITSARAPLMPEPPSGPS
jgi:hypothetical protein